MLFSSIPFLYYFLPIVLALYFIVPKKFKNLVLLLSSLFFYFWGEKTYTLVMLGVSVINYIAGLIIDKKRGTILAKIALISSIIVSIGTLGLFKYADFFISNINAIFRSDIGLLKIIMPIGISFYTFQILSYTIDLYNNKAKVQKNMLNFITYVTLFPQLIAGPIVRYVDVEKELEDRTHSIDKTAQGIGRFIIGLAKKVLISNTLYEFIEISKTTEDSSVLFMWLYAFAYALHIYFDFSGYSDMAIGLGKIFGFNFMENFNYPYISKSITEFWRRWHISLGSWFRDYVYIPLGGNRVSKIKWLRNILIVWALTGFWHGADWSFILWGLMFGLLLLIEKMVIGKNIEKVPTFLSWAYTMFFVLISWVLFDSANLELALERLKVMFGFGSVSIITSETLYYLRSYLVIFIISIISATPLVKNLILKIKEKEAGKKIINVLEPIIYAMLLVIITAYLIDGSFNPFIYFRF